VKTGLTSEATYSKLTTQSLSLKWN